MNTNRKNTNTDKLDDISADAWNAMEMDGKAMLYRNRNWKDDVYVLCCCPDDIRQFLPEDISGTRFDPERNGGLACMLSGFKRGRSRQVLWVRETANIWVALRTLVHEAIHVASFALNDRHIPLDLRKRGAGDCLGFFVEDLLTETLPFFEKKFGILGAALSRQRTREDRLAARGGKGAPLPAMKKLGVAFEHEDKTWRASVVAAICNAEDAPSIFNLVTESGLKDADEDADRVWFSSTEASAFVWADGSQGARAAFASLAHSAIHAAGRILANCGADVDLSKTGSSECVTYFVEHFFENIHSWFLSRFEGSLVFPPSTNLAVAV